MMARELRAAAESAASVQQIPVDPRRPALRVAVAPARWVFGPAPEERSAVPPERLALGLAPEFAEAAQEALLPGVSLGWLALWAAASPEQLGLRLDSVAPAAALAARRAARSGRQAI